MAYLSSDAFKGSIKNNNAIYGAFQREVFLRLSGVLLFLENIEAGRAFEELPFC